MRVALDEHQIAERLLEAHLTRREHRESVSDRERRAANVEAHEQVRRVPPSKFPQSEPVSAQNLEHHQRAGGGRRDVSRAEAPDEARAQAPGKCVHKSAQKRVAAAASFDQLWELRSIMPCTIVSTSHTVSKNHMFWTAIVPDVCII